MKKKTLEKKPSQMDWEDSEPIVKEPLPPRLVSDSEKINQFRNTVSFVSLFIT